MREEFEVKVFFSIGFFSFVMFVINILICVFGIRIFMNIGYF